MRGLHSKKKRQRKKAETIRYNQWAADCPQLFLSWLAELRENLVRRMIDLG